MEDILIVDVTEFTFFCVLATHAILGFCEEQDFEEHLAELIDQLYYENNILKNES